MKNNQINIGAGNTRYPGFVNCDYSDIFNPEYVFNLETDVFPFDDNSVDTVIANHVLEHLGEGYFHCMQEIYRICKHGAIVNIAVPHYRNDNQLHDPTHRRPITWYGLTLFSKKQNREDTGASSKLGLHFNVDFEIIEHEDTINTGHPRYEQLKRLPKKEVEDYAYERNNVFSESRFKLRVVKE